MLTHQEQRIGFPYILGEHQVQTDGVATVPSNLELCLITKVEKEPIASPVEVIDNFLQQGMNVDPLIQVDTHVKMLETKNSIIVDTGETLLKFDIGSGTSPWKQIMKLMS